MFDMIFRDLQQTYIGWPLAWMWMTPGANGKRGVDQNHANCGGHDGLFPRVSQCK